MIQDQPLHSRVLPSKSFKEMNPVPDAAANEFNLRHEAIDEMKVCAIIPAYNEAETLGAVVQATRKYVDKVFVIDDCSHDNTSGVARENGAEVIRHATNGGPGAAMQTGFEMAWKSGYEYVIQVDGDGQHNPDYIPIMLSQSRNCDIVIGSRFLNESHRSYPFVRRIGISFFSWVVNLITRCGVTDVTSGYRVFRLESLKTLRPIPKRHWAIAQTMEAAKKGLRIKEVSVDMPLRRNGRSQFSLLTYSLYPLRMIAIVLRFSIMK